MNHRYIPTPRHQRRMPYIPQRGRTGDSRRGNSYTGSFYSHEVGEYSQLNYNYQRYAEPSSHGSHSFETTGSPEPEEEEWWKDIVFGNSNYPNQRTRVERMNNKSNWNETSLKNKCTKKPAVPKGSMVKTSKTECVKDKKIGSSQTNSEKDKNYKRIISPGTKMVKEKKAILCRTDDTSENKRRASGTNSIQIKKTIPYSENSVPDKTIESSGTNTVNDNNIISLQTESLKKTTDLKSENSGFNLALSQQEVVKETNLDKSAAKAVQCSLSPVLAMVKQDQNIRDTLVILEEPPTQILPDEVLPQDVLDSDKWLTKDDPGMSTCLTKDNQDGMCKHVITDCDPEAQFDESLCEVHYEGQQHESNSKKVVNVNQTTSVTPETKAGERWTESEFPIATHEGTTVKRATAFTTTTSPPCITFCRSHVELVMKKPVVKLTRLSCRELAKYSNIISSQTRTELGMERSEETEILATDNEAPLVGDSTDMSMVDIDSDLPELRPLSVDPRVMSMSLMLRINSNSKVKRKVFRAAKQRAVKEHKLKNKNFDLKKLKQKFQGVVQMTKSLKSIRSGRQPCAATNFIKYPTNSGDLSKDFASNSKLLQSSNESGGRDSEIVDTNLHVVKTQGNTIHGPSENHLLQSIDNCVAVRSDERKMMLPIRNEPLDRPSSAPGYQHFVHQRPFRKHYKTRQSSCLEQSHPERPLSAPNSHIDTPVPFPAASTDRVSLKGIVRHQTEAILTNDFAQVTSTDKRETEKSIDGSPVIPADNYIADKPDMSKSPDTMCFEKVKTVSCKPDTQHHGHKFSHDLIHMNDLNGSRSKSFLPSHKNEINLGNQAMDVNLKLIDFPKLEAHKQVHDVPTKDLLKQVSTVNDESSNDSTPELVSINRKSINGKEAVSHRNDVNCAIDLRKNELPLSCKKSKPIIPRRNSVVTSTPVVIPSFQPVTTINGGIPIPVSEAAVSSPTLWVLSPLHLGRKKRKCRKKTKAVRDNALRPLLPKASDSLSYSSSCLAAEQNCQEPPTYLPCDETYNSKEIASIMGDDPPLNLSMPRGEKRDLLLTGSIGLHKADYDSDDTIVDPNDNGQLPDSLYVPNDEGCKDEGEITYPFNRTSTNDKAGKDSPVATVDCPSSSHLRLTNLIQTLRQNLGKKEKGRAHKGNKGKASSSKLVNDRVNENGDSDSNITMQCIKEDSLISLERKENDQLNNSEEKPSATDDKQTTNRSRGRRNSGVKYLSCKEGDTGTLVKRKYTRRTSTKKQSKGDSTKKVAFCEADDPLADLPPKRRRLPNKSVLAQSKQMEDVVNPVHSNISRLAQEFPRHNWLENKIKQISGSQHSTSVMGPLNASMSSTLKVDPKSTKSVKSETLEKPADSRTAEDSTVSTLVDTSLKIEKERVIPEVSDKQISKVNETDHLKTKEDELPKQDLIPESPDLNKVQVLSPNELLATNSPNKNDNVTNKPLIECEPFQSNTSLGDMCEDDPLDDSGELVIDLSVKPPCNKTPTTTTSCLTATSTDDLSHSETVLHQSETTVPSPNQTDVSHAQNKVPTLDTRNDTDTNIFSIDMSVDALSSNTQSPLSVTEMKDKAEEKEDKATTMEAAPSVQSAECHPNQTIAIHDLPKLLNQNLKPNDTVPDNSRPGPPVLKVLPQMKPATDASQQSETSIQISESTSCQSSQAVPFTNSSCSSIRQTVPPIPPLVPLEQPRPQKTDGLLSQVSSHRQYFDHNHRHSVDILRDREQHQGVSLSETTTTSTSSACQNTLKRSGSPSVTYMGPKAKYFNSVGSTACPETEASETNQETQSPNVRDRPLTPASPELQSLMSEFKILEKLAREKEKERDEVYRLRRQKKEEMVRRIREHKRAITQQTDFFVASDLNKDPKEGPFSSKIEMTDDGYSLSTESSRVSVTNFLGDFSGRTRAGGGTDPSTSSNHVQDDSPEGGSSGIDLSLKRRPKRVIGPPPEAHCFSPVDSVWAMLEIPPVTRSSVESCPYIRRSTRCQPLDFSSGIRQIEHAGPAHCQKPFQTAGVIITPQSTTNSDTTTQRGRYVNKSKNHSTQKEANHTHNDSATYAQQPPPTKNPGLRETVAGNRSIPGDVDRSYNHQTQYSARPKSVDKENVTRHMTLPVDPQMKPRVPKSTSREAENVLEYVDLSKSPEHIYRRVALPPGMHVGDRFIQNQMFLKTGSYGPQVHVSSMQHTPQGNPYGNEGPKTIHRSGNPNQVEGNRYGRDNHQSPHQDVHITGGNGGIPVYPKVTDHSSVYKPISPAGEVMYPRVPCPPQISPNSQFPPPSSMHHHTIRMEPNNSVNSGIDRNHGPRKTSQEMPQASYVRHQNPEAFRHFPVNNPHGQYIIPHSLSSDPTNVRPTMQSVASSGHPPQLVQALVRPSLRPRHPMPAQNRPSEPRSTVPRFNVYNPPVSTQHMQQQQQQQRQLPIRPQLYPYSTNSTYEPQKQPNKTMQQFATGNRMILPLPGQLNRHSGMVDMTNVGSEESTKPAAQPGSQYYRGPHLDMPVQNVQEGFTNRMPMHQTQVYQPQVSPIMNAPRMPAKAQSVNARMSEFTCAECFQKASMICSRCESVRYCSKQCQVNGWMKHGQVCKPR